MTDDRVARHRRVSAALAARSDRQLGLLVDQAETLGTGIGGTSALLEICGTSVFVKRIRLTDMERKAASAGSTANLFELPVNCQYGVGSPGFGAWRELAACTMTTEWVLAGLSAAFPLLYHWRVLPGVGRLTGETASIDRAVEYWDHSPQVRVRLEALADATVSLVLFVEFVPHTLQEWLADQVRSGRAATEAAAALVESQLLATVDFMNSRELYHFDAHFGNVLTDGRQLFLSDFGLATSPRFELSEPEVRFLEHNRTHDMGYAAMRLVNWLVAAFGGIDPLRGGSVDQRNGLVRDVAAGAEIAGAPEAISRQLRRHAPVAAVMNDFYYELFTASRAVRYPAARVAEALTERT